MQGQANDALEELRAKREHARLGGGLKRQEAIRSSGRGTARDRIGLLLDEGSFLEIDSFVTHRTDDHNMFLHQTLVTASLRDRVPLKGDASTASLKISASTAEAWVKCTP